MKSIKGCEASSRTIHRHACLLPENCYPQILASEQLLLALFVEPWNPQTRTSRDGGAAVSIGAPFLRALQSVRHVASVDRRQVYLPVSKNTTGCHDRRPFSRLGRQSARRGPWSVPRDVMIDHEISKERMLHRGKKLMKQGQRLLLGSFCW